MKARVAWNDWSDVIPADFLSIQRHRQQTHGRAELLVIAHRKRAIRGIQHL